MNFERFMILQPYFLKIINWHLLYNDLVSNYRGSYISQRIGFCIVYIPHYRWYSYLSRLICNISSVFFSFDKHVFLYLVFCRNKGHRFSFCVCSLFLKMFTFLIVRPQMISWSLGGFVTFKWYFRFSVKCFLKFRVYF